MLQFEATINQHLAYITSDPRLADGSFLRAALASRYEILRFLSEGAGSTKGALTCEQLKQFKVPLPPLTEQRAIVEYANQATATLDALAAKVRAAIERFQEYRTALISAAVTGQIDVRGEMEKGDG
jgi:type I restriction enzyme S subunit